MLKLLDINDFTKNLTPVTSAEIFSKGDEFNENSLFSERIFGSLDTSERSKTYSYINLNTKLIHPAALKIIIQLDRKIEKILSTELVVSLDNEGKLIEDSNGFSGINEFMNIFPKIKWRTESDVREKYVKFLTDSYKDGTIFIDKIPVIPPDFRPAYKDEDGNWNIDNLNIDYYQSIIKKSIQVNSAKGSGILFDLLCYGLQIAINNHDEYIRSKLGKKSGIVRNFMMGKRVDFSGRAVITPGPEIGIDELGIPMKIAAGIFEPFIIHFILYAQKIDINELRNEMLKYMNLDLNLENIKIVLRAIKSGDIIPPNLYKIFKNATEASIKDRVVIYKRDPVLHAESIRAAHPVITDGKTLLLNPMLCGGFNADFDGDSCDCFIALKINNNKINKIHISELEKLDIVRYKSKDKHITKYDPIENIEIKSINMNNGEISYKKVLEYSKHENLEMYKISDNKNRFKDFWCSIDHSLIIYDAINKEIKKISPLELLKNPNDKFILKQKKY